MARYPHVFLALALSSLPFSVNSGTHPPFTGEDLTGRPCTGAYGGYGPFDYTKRANIPFNLNIVERRHFTPAVESLTRGETGVDPYGDLNYTLRAWPNHHRALYAMARYTLRAKKRGKKVLIPAECWFQRAISFSPRDATVYMLYGLYLQLAGKPDQAEEYYIKSLKINDNNSQTHYNYALLLLEKKEYEKAKKHAMIAYKNNYPLQGLKNKLKAAGRWP